MNREVIRDRAFDSLGNLGVYQEAINGISRYKAVYAEDEKGNLYTLGGIRLEDKGLVLYIKKISEELEK